MFKAKTGRSKARLHPGKRRTYGEKNVMGSEQMNKQKGMSEISTNEQISIYKNKFIL